MKTSKFFLFIFMMFSFAFSTIANAQSNNLDYRCPKLKEIGRMQDVITSYNDKDIHWKMISNNNLMTNDKPVEFVKAVLEKNNSESYDMSLSCVYRTEENKKFIISPLANFYMHVDGVAEKALGNEWYIAANDTLECNKSVAACRFIFR